MGDYNKTVCGIFQHVYHLTAPSLRWQELSTFLDHVVSDVHEVAPSDGGIRVTRETVAIDTELPVVYVSFGCVVGGAAVAVVTGEGVRDDQRPQAGRLAIVQL